MRIVAAITLLALAACQKVEPAAPPPLAALSPATLAAASPVAKPTPVLGWTAAGGDFLLLGRQAPAFSGKLVKGGTFDLGKLRGHWTIVGFHRADSTDPLEDTFASALNSAVGQDPDLSFLRIVAPSPPLASGANASARSAPMRTIVDADRKIVSAFGVAEMPLYLLIGPDLTIEAVRGRLADSPDNGIKDVIRGVAEIRKQIADPT